MDAMRLLPALALALWQLAAAAADALPEADTREIRSYVLTEAALGKYVQATRKLSAIRLECSVDDSGVDDLSDAAAKIDAVPGAKRAMRSAGITSREYVVFAFALIENAFAAHALDQPGGKLPPGISMANVDFFRKHADEIAKLGKETEVAGCEEAEGG
jgi:hypothetical protein